MTLSYVPPPALKMGAEGGQKSHAEAIALFVTLQSVRETTSLKGIHLLLLVEERVARNRRIGRLRADSPDIDVFEQY